MIISDFHLGRSLLRPDEADPILIVDPDAVLSQLTGIPDRTLDRWMQGLREMPRWAEILMDMMRALVDHGYESEIQRWGRRTTSPAELKAWADEWPTHYWAAHALGVDPTKLSRMINGRRAIPSYVARMLDLDRKLRMRGLQGLLPS